jgi:protein-disulfide isomerase
MAARCAGPEKALTMVSALFTRQEDWAKSKSLEELTGKLFPLGQQVGLTRQAFNACFPGSTSKLTTGQQSLLTNLLKNRERGAAFGVDKTPTFFVNGNKLDGATTIEDFDKALEPLLKG